jgi:hypothetical protein
MAVSIALMTVDLTYRRRYDCFHMKLTSIVWRSLVGVACMSFVLSAAAVGEKQEALKPGYREWRAVVYTKVTGRLVPERVLLHGSIVNSASPLAMIQGSELHSRGSTSLAGMLSIDPNITSRGQGR